MNTEAYGEIPATGPVSTVKEPLREAVAELAVTPVWRYQLGQNQCAGSVTRHNRQLIVPDWRTSCVRVLTEGGHLVQTVSLPGDLQCCGIGAVSASHLILTATRGLYLLHADTLAIAGKLCDGQFARGLDINEGRVTALRVGTKEVVEIAYSPEAHSPEAHSPEAHSPEAQPVVKTIILRGKRDFGPFDTVVSDASTHRLCVAHWWYGKVSVYDSLTGDVLAVHSKTFPLLASVDTLGLVVCVHDRGHHCVSVLGPSGRWVKVIRHLWVDGYIDAIAVHDKDIFFCTSALEEYVVHRWTLATA